MLRAEIKTLPRDEMGRQHDRHGCWRAYVELDMRGKKVAQVLYKNKNRFGRMGITRLGIFLTSGLADRKATRICGPGELKRA